MKKHLIKDYVMMELANNDIINLHTETDPQKRTWSVLKHNSYEYWTCPDWTAPWRIIWTYDLGPGIFYGTDAEFRLLTQWADAEIQSLIQDDL